MRGCTLAPGIISISPLAQLGNESKFNSAVAKIAHYSRRVLFFRRRIEFPRTHLTDDTRRNAKPRVAPDEPAAVPARFGKLRRVSFAPAVFFSLEPARLRNSCVEGFLAWEKSGVPAPSSGTMQHVAAVAETKGWFCLPCSLGQMSS